MKIHGNHLPADEYHHRKRLRLIEKVTVDPKSGCWLHPGGVTKAGYAQDNWRSKREDAHRVSFRAFNGDIPDDMQVCHSCDVKICINPKHLFLGTVQVNADDKVSKDRQCRGETRPLAKLTEADVRKIRLLAAEGVSHTELAKMFNYARANVTRLVNGKIWKHVK